MYHDESTTENSPACRALLDALRQSPAVRIILVTNEVGMGIVPEHPLSRRFRDVAGRLNQCIAAIADRVLLTVCGQVLTVKGCGNEDVWASRDHRADAARDHPGRSGLARSGPEPR